jgi:hypothetical protein
MKKTYSVFCILILLIAVARAETAIIPTQISDSKSSKIDESDLSLSDESLGLGKGQEVENKKSIKSATKEEIEFDAPIDPSYMNEPFRASPIAKEEAREDELEDDDLYFDDFSNLGINMNELLKEKKTAGKKIKEESVAPIKEEKKIDIGLLQLSCDEFSGRLMREAFTSCGIVSKEYLNSKIELTIDGDGRISMFDSSMNLVGAKKLCLSGYVASTPAKNVGADFTCRVYFQGITNI